MSYLTLAVLLHWATAAIAPAHAGASAGAQRARPVIISTDPGGPIHRRLFVTGVAQGIGAALLRSADLILWQAHALDMVVIFEAL